MSSSSRPPEPSGSVAEGRVTDGIRALSKALQAREKDLRGKVDSTREHVGSARETTAARCHEIAERGNLISKRHKKNALALPPRRKVRLEEESPSLA